MWEISGKIKDAFKTIITYYVPFYFLNLLPCLSRAVNNELIDTYQLKSLDGLAEARLEKIVIAQQKEEGERRLAGKKKEKRKQLYLMLNKYMHNRNSFDATQEELPGHHIDNFPMRKPYDRVIRCLGFRFNFSIFDR